MIQDFLEVNKLNGKVVTFPSDISIEKVASCCSISSSGIAKSFVFVDDKVDFFVVVALKGEKVSVGEAEKLFNKKNLEIATEKDVYRITSFEERYFPPIGVFGATVALHSSVKGKKNLLFELGARDFLIIESKDIKKANNLGEELQ